MCLFGDHGVPLFYTVRFLPSFAFSLKILTIVQLIMFYFSKMCYFSNVWRSWLLKNCNRLIDCVADFFSSTIDPLEPYLPFLEQLLTYLIFYFQQNDSQALSYLILFSWELTIHTFIQFQSKYEVSLSKIHAFKSLGQLK